MLTITMHASYAGDHIYLMDLSRFAAGGIDIVPSGEQTTENASFLCSSILRQPKNNKKHSPATVHVSTISSASTGFDSKKTYVFLLIGNEMKEALPPTLLNLLPLDVRKPDSSLSLLSCEFLDKKEHSFVITLFAPDKERFDRIFNEFMGRTYKDQDKGFPYRSSYASNKVALFSTPELRPILDNWGQVKSPRTWNFVEWHSLDEYSAIPPEKLKEYDQVFAFDRSQDVTAPQQVQTVSDGQNIQPTTIFVNRSTGEDNHALVVFSAPNSTLLQTRLQHFPTVQAINEGPHVEDVVDLRHVGRAPLLVSGVSSRDERDQIRQLIAKDMRDTLHLDIEERGSVLRALNEEVALQQLMGATDTAKKLRRNSGSRYVWMFTITRYDGATDYSAEEKCLSAPLAPVNDFTSREPQRGDRKYGFMGPRISEDEYQERHSSWAKQHYQWERDRDAHDNAFYNTDVQWQRNIVQTSRGNVGGILRLVDLDDKGHVVWEKECSRTETKTSLFNSDRVSVRGYGSRPNSMSMPNSGQGCPPDLMRRTAELAAAQGLILLRDSAWLPERGAAPPPADTPAEQKTNETDAETEKPAVNPDASQVAFADGKIVTITIGAAEGVHVGDRVIVELAVREIKHPTTGEVLERIVTDAVNLRVTRVGKTSDCVPLSAGDSAKLGKVELGMAVKWVPAPKAAPAKTHPPVKKPAPQKARVPVKKK